ncbi:MAG: hypothetical protein MI976_11400 [Pseudomonadales bacterium]|nr:hypothetical protein [Pseudomonadales bacterium]
MNNQINKTFIVMILGFFIFSFVTTEIAIAEIKKPSFVQEANADDLEKAGDEISKWIFIFMAIVIGLFSVRPGYLFVTGKPEEALEKSKEIIIGVVIAVVLGGIAFAVIEQISG